MMPMMAELSIDPDGLLAEWDGGIEITAIERLVVEGRANGLADALHPIAQKIDWAGTVMIERRRVAERIDPWRYGLLLAFLCQPVYQDDEDMVVSRFEVFQAVGYWEHREFNEWADEFTGVRTKTWMGWRRCADEYLLSTVGRAYLRRLGLTPMQFVEATTIDKALRACATIARGQLEQHQLEALADETVTSEGMRHALRVEAGEWEEMQEESEKRRQEWKFGDESDPLLEFDPSKRVVRLKWVVSDTGEVKEHTVVRLPVPGHEMVARKQQEILDWLGL